jgi:hypothetical protein
LNDLCLLEVGTVPTLNPVPVTLVFSRRANLEVPDNAKISPAGRWKSLFKEAPQDIPWSRDTRVETRRKEHGVLGLSDHVVTNRCVVCTSTRNVTTLNRRGLDASDLEAELDFAFAEGLDVCIGTEELEVCTGAEGLDVCNGTVQVDLETGVAVLGTERVLDSVSPDIGGRRVPVTVTKTSVNTVEGGSVTVVSVQ